MNAYIPEKLNANPLIDPFLSPLVASKDLLSKFPKVFIVTGESDPLHDEA